MNNINNLNTVNLNGINPAIDLQGLDAVAKADKTGILAGAGLTVSEAKAAGTAAAVGAPVLPEAETADTTISENIIDNIAKSAEQLEKLLTEELKDVRTTAGASSDTMLVDIYQVMNLLLQIARKQREVSRVQSAADLANSVAAIKAQAAEIRGAALLGLGLSLALSVASAGFQLHGLKKSLTAQQQLTNIKNNSGLTQATELTKLSAGAANQVSATNQANTLAGKLTATQQQTAAEHLAPVEQAKAQVEAAQHELNGAKQTLEQSVTELNELKIELARLRTNGADSRGHHAGVEVPDLEIGGRSRVDVFKRDGEVKVQDFDKYPKIAELKTKIENKAAEVELLKQEVAPRETKLAEAKRNYATALDAHLDALVGDGNAKLTVGQQYEVAKNLQLRQENGMGESVTDLRRRSTDKQTVISNELELSDDFVKANQVKDRYSAYSGICTTLSQILGNVSSTASTIWQSSATEKEALAKQEEYQKQVDDETAANAKELLSQVIQMLSSVNQMQNQSIERAMGA